MKTITPVFLIGLHLSFLASLSSVTADDVLRGKAAMGDWTTDAPGVRRHLTLNDLPEPYATESAENPPKIVPRPTDAWPKVPDGFTVTLFTNDLKNPRKIITAPNGDIFVAESMANRVRVLRDADGDGKPELSEVFADNLKLPFGLAFYPPGPDPKFLYIGNTDAVVRLPYHNGQTKAQGQPEQLVNLSPGGFLTGGGHWTRDVVFSLDGKKMFVSIGSKSNVDDTFVERIRARIYQYDPDGKNERVYAWGIRNAVGLAIHSRTGELWMSTNERDGLGDELVPDYISRVQEGGFYGWPWFYMGGHQDPRHKGKRPELKNKVLTPDVLLQSHSASLCMTFCDAPQFPAEYRLNAFAAEHGSWNRSRRTGYKVIRVPTINGKANGEYIDFMTGFVTPAGNVWGRPVGVTFAKDSSLLVSDDGGNCIWRISVTQGRR